MLYAVGSCCCCHCHVARCTLWRCGNVIELSPATSFDIFVSPQNEFRGSQSNPTPPLSPPPLPCSGVLRCCGYSNCPEIRKYCSEILWHPQDTLVPHVCSIFAVLVDFGVSVCVWICLIARKPKTIPCNPLDPADSSPLRPPLWLVQLQLQGVFRARQFEILM